MLFVIDAGNTDIVFALFSKTDQILLKKRYPLHKNMNSDLLIVYVESFMEVKNVSSVIISSVVPYLDKILQRFTVECFRRSPVFLSSLDFRKIENFNLHGEGSEKLSSFIGSDRVANLVGTLKKYNMPMMRIIIDLGTAMTVDVLTKINEYEGGVIFPGPQLTMESLYHGTALLPKLPFEKSPFICKRITKQAMISGVFWGYIGAIEKILDNLIIPTDHHKIIITGGYVSIFKEYFSFDYEIDENLTLQGLYYIYKDIC